MKSPWIKIFLLASIAAIAALPNPLFGQKAITLQVVNVKAAGNVEILFRQTNAAGMVTNTKVKVAVAATDTPAMVAANIATALGMGVMSNGSTVSFDVPVGTTAGFGIISNDAIKGKLDTEQTFGALPPPNLRLALLGFQPNPDNGDGTLLTDAEITVGFASGLSPVSFEAPAGDDTEELASLLDSELTAGGYMVSMPDPDEVLLDAAGISLPAEVDFELDPLGTVGDAGIETTISFPTPEPGSFTLVSLGALLLGMAIVFRRDPLPVG